MTISRRELLQLGAGIGLISTTGEWRPLQADTETRITTVIPSSGEQLPA
ncbi:unnamed protein product, partial [marine sediment metagenome]